MICFQAAAAACRSCLTRVRSPQIVHSPGMRSRVPRSHLAVRYVRLDHCSTQWQRVAGCGNGTVGRQHEKRPSDLLGLHAQQGDDALTA